MFVPKIMFCTDQNRIKSFIIWGDAIPLVLPKVDILVLIKDKLAPFRIFSKKPVVSIVDYNKAKELFPNEEVNSEQGLSYIMLRYNNPPKNIIDFFVNQKPGKIQGIAVDQILDAELVVKAKESAASMKKTFNTELES